MMPALWGLHKHKVVPAGDAGQGHGTAQMPPASRCQPLEAANSPKMSFFRCFWHLLALFQLTVGSATRCSCCSGDLVVLLGKVLAFPGPSPDRKHFQAGQSALPA